MITILADNLSKFFGGVRAVNGLSVSIEPKKITSIIGPNGSGKTTLTNILSGMLAPDAGSMVIAGKTINRLAPHQAAGLGITRTFQDVRLFEQMSVADNISVVLTSRGVLRSLMPCEDCGHRAREILEQMHLWEKRDQLARNLSYGQRKLLEIGRALAMDADTYLFDEPFAGLFPEMVLIIKEIVIRLRDTGRAVVLIEHDMALIRELSDWVIVMDNGKLLTQGSAEEVLSDRAVIEAYLGE